MKKNILLVEDDQTLSNGISLVLQSDLISITPCFTLSSARTALLENSFDLVLLDINLPDGSGLTLLKELHATSIPIILLTANDTEMDIVLGLEMGASDYITKPFSLAILRARVHAQLRSHEMNSSKLYEIDEFFFDFDHMTFTKHGHIVELSKTEQKLLKVLLENKNQTLSRSTLIDRLWVDTNFVDENALSVTIKRLRDKLEDTPSSPIHIKTIYGLGYTWK